MVQDGRLSLFDQRYLRHAKVRYFNGVAFMVQDGRLSLFSSQSGRLARVGHFKGTAFMVQVWRLPPFSFVLSITWSSIERGFFVPLRLSSKPLAKTPTCGAQSVDCWITQWHIVRSPRFVCRVNPILTLFTIQTKRVIALLLLIATNLYVSVFLPCCVFLTV